ncbi:hypothetical protein BZM27_37060 [Paraburkholderia steynii]|uniref:Uncharacterized protein n=1 Tax=Paraburkholderia steynii TaxID=1245441 RepID=A0A4R0X7X1_9BURK|nr:hypothetical protein BZM27_37060 [Paraburkholderia steynii]
MHPRATNISTQGLDVCRFSFEPADALAFVNEYSGFAVAPAHYIGFGEHRHAHLLLGRIGLSGRLGTW